MMYILMVVYQWLMLGVDFLNLIFRSMYLYGKAIWHLFIIPPLKSVTGEIILVTGAGHGIGRELALQFSRLGAKVVCWDINEESNNNTVSDIGKEGGTAWGFKCDVSSRENVKAVSDKVRLQVGDITVLVNNAGIMPCKAFLKHTPEDIERIFKINVFSHFWTIREWLPTFLAAGRGHVVALSSICGIMGTKNLVPYCSSKFAVRGLMDGLIEEIRYGGLNPNIKFTSVFPFVIDTGLAQKPRIRFPSFNPITTPESCAEKIVEGMRREDEEVCIPSKDFYGHKLKELMPRAVQKAFLDFMDTGCDEHES